MTREITLTRGFVALVDDEWFDHLSQYRWCAAKGNGGKFYAARKAGGAFIWMHRVIGGDPAGLRVDHRNRDTLDNHESNLRPATHAQNSANRSGWRKGFRGISPHRRRWRAAIGVNGRVVRIGSYETEIDAARAYDEAALRLHGEFAVLNFPPLLAAEWARAQINALTTEL